MIATSTRFLVLLAASMSLTACPTSSGETTDTDASTSAATDSTASPTSTTATTTTTTTTTDATTDPGPTTTEATTGALCPDNACSTHDDAGVCDGSTAIACTVDANGCRIPGEPTQCESACMAGICCGEFGGVDCECISNPCLDNGLGEGWHCVDNQEVYCLDFIDCIVPFNGTPVDCGSNACNPETGTCGGCKPDECYTEQAGTKLCGTSDANSITGATCALVNGCMQETEVETCVEYCEYGKGCAP